MTALPSSLALTSIADGANIVAADHRNNYTAIQAAVNTLISALSGGTAGQVLEALSSSSVGYVGPRASYQASPADAAALGAFGGVYKMAGLAGAITPGSTGTVLFMISGSWLGSASPSFAQIRLRTGTGAAPVNAAAEAGTLRSNTTVYEAATTATQPPFVVTAIVTGFAVGTAVWFDASAYDGGNGNLITLKSITMTAVEL